jgi:hypothetical protein
MTLKPTETKKYNVAQFGRMRQIMEQLKVEIKGSKEDVLKDIASKFLGALIKRSPILTGRYVKSHKVGIDQKDTSTASLIGTLQKDRRSAAASALMSGLNVIRSAQKFNAIYISNSLHYAHKVEYTGWKNSPPYFVYHHATMDMMGKADEVIKKYTREAVKRALEGKKGRKPKPKTDTSGFTSLAPITPLAPWDPTLKDEIDNSGNIVIPNYPKVKTLGKYKPKPSIRSKIDYGKKFTKDLKKTKYVYGDTTGRDYRKLQDLTEGLHDKPSKKRH